MAKNTNKKGRNKEPAFVLLTHNLIDSEAYKSLSSGAVQVLVLLTRYFNGSNNGSIGMSCRRIRNLTGMSKNTASNKLHELELKGFIVPTHKGMFTSRLATEYRLTFKEMQPNPPTHDWKRYCKKQNRVPDIELTVSSIGT